MIRSVNPYNDQLLETFEETGKKELESKLSLAEKTYKDWSHTSFNQRAGLLRETARLLRNNKNEYARIITLEMGKIIRESVAEVEKCAWVCDYFADHAQEFLMDDHFDLDQGHGMVMYQPIGTILGIMPWNFPFWQVFRFAAPTLMAGNNIVLKHATNVPQCAFAIEKIFREAGAPEGVFQNVFVSVPVIDETIGDPRIRGVSLTGSIGAGSKVGELAGKYIKKVVLELGGSDPYLVFSDASLKEAAETAVKARMANCGQRCNAGKRFIINRTVAREFLEKFRDGIHNLNFGDPLDEKTDYASMANPSQKEKLNKQVEESINKGAKLFWQEDKVPHGDSFYNPAILTGIKPGMPAYDEELFGPVANVFVVNDNKEALVLANDTEYGLGASLWSEDIEAAKTFAQEVKAGVVYINDQVASRPELPFGGIGKSGVGRELSKTGIREFTNKKSVWFPV